MSETLHERLTRLIQNAVDSGQYKNATAALKACGLTSGYLGELRVRKTPNPSMRLDKAVGVALALGVSLFEVTGEAEPPVGDDPDPERAWAVIAARAMQLPEAAIQTVLKEQTGAGDRWYWWLRIETEAAKLGRPPARRLG